MAEEKKQENRPFWAFARIQGLLLIAVGIGMCFMPATAPYAGTVIAAGLGGLGTGTASAIARKVFNGKPK